MNPFERLLEQAQKNLLKAEERLSEALFSTKDYEIIEKVNDKFESIKKNN